MTRKDYVRLAAALKDSHDTIGDRAYRNYSERVSGWLFAAFAIEDALAAENGRFDRERFRRAAGYNR